MKPAHLPEDSHLIKPNAGAYRPLTRLLSSFDSSNSEIENMILAFSGGYETADGQHIAQLARKNYSTYMMRRHEKEFLKATSQQQMQIHKNSSLELIIEALDQFLQDADNPGLLQRIKIFLCADLCYMAKRDCNSEPFIAVLDKLLEVLRHPACSTSWSLLILQVFAQRAARDFLLEQHLEPLSEYLLDDKFSNLLSISEGRSHAIHKALNSAIDIIASNHDESPQKIEAIERWLDCKLSRFFDDWSAPHTICIKHEFIDFAQHSSEWLKIKLIELAQQKVLEWNDGASCSIQQKFDINGFMLALVEKLVSGVSNGVGLGAVASQHEKPASTTSPLSAIYRATVINICRDRISRLEFHSGQLTGNRGALFNRFSSSAPPKSATSLIIKRPSI